MKNVLDERPTTELHGGTAYARDFVAAPDYAQRDVLDIGCGFGWFELAAADRGARSVVGVEPEEAALETARRHVALAQVTFRAANAVSLPFEDESFDTAVSTVCLCTVPDQQRALAEVRRVLRPGGRFLFLEHVRSADPRMARRQDRLNPVWRAVTNGCNCNRATLEAIEQAGFTVEAVERGELPKQPSWVKPYVLGRATK